MVHIVPVHILLGKARDRRAKANINGAGRDSSLTVKGRGQGGRNYIVA